MKTVEKTFKTTLKCAGCVASAKPHLDANTAISSWQVDLNGPVKHLHVTVEESKVESVITSLKNAGFDASLA